MLLLKKKKRFRSLDVLIISNYCYEGRKPALVQKPRFGFRRNKKFCVSFVYCLKNAESLKEFKELPLLTHNPPRVFAIHKGFSYLRKCLFYFCASLCMKAKQVTGNNLLCLFFLIARRAYVHDSNLITKST